MLKQKYLKKNNEIKASNIVNNTSNMVNNTSNIVNNTSNIVNNTSENKLRP